MQAVRVEIPPRCAGIFSDELICLQVDLLWLTPAKVSGAVELACPGNHRARTDSERLQFFVTSTNAPVLSCKPYVLVDNPLAIRVALALTKGFGIVFGNQAASSQTVRDVYDRVAFVRRVNKPLRDKPLSD